MDIDKFGHNSFVTWTEADLRKEREEDEEIENELKNTRESKKEL